MADMDSFRRMAEVFSEYNISTPDQLEERLAEASERGKRYFPTNSEWAGEPEPPGHLLARSVCSKLAALAGDVARLSSSPGINQFSLLASQRLPETDLRKAMFLSRRAIVISSHEFHYAHNEQYNPLASGDWTQTTEEDWTISNSYIRDLFTYRDAIRSGTLLMFPRKLVFVETTDRAYKRPHEIPRIVMDLADMARTTRIIDVTANQELIDRIIQHYRARRQLIILPELEVPWVDNITIPKIIHVREESRDEWVRFHEAYHELLLRQIEIHRSVDFARLSRNINEEVIEPALSDIDQKYRRIVSQHRSLRVPGATVGLLPVRSLLLSGRAFRKLERTKLARDSPMPLVRLLADLGSNGITRRNALNALGESTFYVLWRVQREQGASRPRRVRSWGPQIRFRRRH
jgi:hypothetical protein